MNIEVLDKADLKGIAARNTASVEKAQMATAHEFERLARPYVPFRTGQMSKSTYRSDFRSGEVTYDTEYAEYIYKADPNRTHLTRDHNPNATVAWGDFVASKYKEDLMRTFERSLET